MLDPEFASATYPLFQNSEVEILEWSFDSAWKLTEIPQWADDLLRLYSNENQLIGHGITLSLFSGMWNSSHEEWLSLFSKECKKRKYRHVSEHFGFITNRSLAPLPTPITPDLINAMAERLERLKSVSEIPIGIENLAFAFGRKDVFEQGIFLGNLLKRTNGFLLLDLHNIYCQLQNFNLAADELLSTFPLEFVREIHLSGGSWLASNSKIRRDTHDEAVPAPVFKLLESVLKKCPNIECVILERLGHTLKNGKDASQLQTDFHTIKKIVSGTRYDG